MVNVGETVVIKMGKYEGFTGEVISTDGLKLVVKTTDETGHSVEVNLYQTHVKLAK